MINIFYLKYCFNLWCSFGRWCWN